MKSSLRQASLALVLALGLFPRTGLRAQTWNAADVLGPDGIIYPDWSFAGVPGGIPTGGADCGSVTLQGAVANDNLDDSAALEAAATACGQAGGGVISIPAGSFHLDRPIFIKHSGVVLRGAGRDTTKLIFRFAAPSQDVAFFFPSGVSNNTLAKNNWLEVHADPTDLQRLSIKYNGQVVSERLRSTGHWGASFSLRVTGSTLAGKSGYGSAKSFVAEAEYPNGLIRTETVSLTLNNAQDANAIPNTGYLGAINFNGTGRMGNTFLLAQDGLRGQTSLTLSSGHTVVAGDFLEIFAEATARWNDEVDNACTTSTNFRRYQVKAVAVSGNVVTLNQPLRIDFPTIDGSYVQKFTPMTGNGVESLTLEQTQNIWTNGIIFNWAWGSWARNVRVNKAGRFPLYFNASKFCEIRDSIIDDAWFKGDGGTAYVGFEYAYDCLMDGVTTYEMRHGPLVQWSAAGNVVRRSKFVNSDIQWHAGWTNENLFEQVTVESNRGTGAYGYGMWASPPEDTAHGPNGPRNVVYNSDVTSPKLGAWLGGMNRGWIFAYNRIQSDSGEGLFAKDSSSDHTITGNVFSLRSAGSGIRLETNDCTGVKLTSNDFYGVQSPTAISTGAGTPAVAQNNTTVDVLSPSLFTNPGFESGWTGWTQDASDGGMSQLSASAAYQGSQGLRVTDASSTLGSSVHSAAFAVQPNKTYGVRYWQRIVSGSNGGMGLYIQFFSSSGSQLQSRAIGLVSGSNWQRVLVRETAPPGAATAQIWLHSYSNGIVTADFDQFEFGELAPELGNGGFESSLTSWDTSGDNGMSQASTSAKYSGTYGLRVTDSSATLGSSLRSARLTAQAGWTYQVRFWARQLSGTGVAIHLRFLDSAQQELSQSLKSLPAQAEWREYTVRADAPANTASVEVWIRSGDTSQVTADFDDLLFSESPPRPTPAVASIFEWQRNPVFPLPNPGFESGLAGWDMTSDNGMSLATSTAARSGGQGLRVTDASTSVGSSAYSPSYFVQPGRSYRLLFWSRVVSGNSGMGVYIKFHDANGAEITSATVNRTVPNSATSWTQLQVNGVAPANAVTARIWLHSYGASVVTVDLDDLEFIRL
ncbi:carbohydrate binding domain-containing protein [Hyalangium rubrum]|uniref:Carbohydrate binding domain-containing protein n=1 Tax=Hyalangium rubrum TaxID=3103134 RepID=A0ABU5H7T2_9BACT|nr:carbohydrate binding domain-containing protein [Hyalangium sp. s54d21]MDY7229321.1 carbohydrate binding domain-containing protein [Hyalangium sp. s54d21]